MSDAFAESPAQSYFAISGVVTASSHAVRRFMAAAWLARTVYNAAIDRHVAFADGLAFRLALSDASRMGTTPPEAPERSEKFRPAPDQQKLCKELTAIKRGVFGSLLSLVPRSLLDTSIEHACRAVSKHVENCVEAKKLGGKLPRLRWRGAADPQSVTTVNFTLRRPGDGPAQPRPRSGGRATSATLRNRRRRARLLERREEAWAETKRRAGWSEAKIECRLARRARRRLLAQERNADVDAERRATEKKKNAGKAPRIRSDSPQAIIGLNSLNLHVQGIGELRLRLTRPVPKGAVVKAVTLLKEPGHTAKLQVRLTMTVPDQEPVLDELRTGAMLHAAVRQLSPAAPPLAYVEAVRAVGILVRGEDLNIVNPSCDDTGRTTPRVPRPRKEVAEAAAGRRELAWKDRCFKADNASAAAKAARVDEARTAKAEGRRVTRRAKRSKRAEKIRVRLSVLARKEKNRSRTRACQDAAALVHGTDRNLGPLKEGEVRAAAPRPVLVATDPKRMVVPLLRKGSPADRREADGAKPPKDGFMTAARIRAMRSNLHYTRLGLRIDRTAVLCAREGIIHATPGHEGTTQLCCSCGKAVPKDLRERVHSCHGCGFAAPRDMNSALNTLGRALRAFREGPDPGGRVALAREAEAKRLVKVAEFRARRSGAGKAKDKAVVGLGSDGGDRESPKASPAARGAEHQEDPRAQSHRGIQTEALPVVCSLRPADFLEDDETNLVGLCHDDFGRAQDAHLVIFADRDLHERPVVLCNPEFAIKDPDDDLVHRTHPRRRQDDEDVAALLHPYVRVLDHPNPPKRAARPGAPLLEGPREALSQG